MKSYRQSMATEKGRPVFFRDEPPDRLSNPKQSGLNTYIRAALSRVSRL